MPQRPVTTATKKRKKCTGPCGKTRVVTKFRLLKSGYRQGMCESCERDYERDRWHTRSKESKRSSGLSPLQRRRRAQVAA